MPDPGLLKAVVLPGQCAGGCENGQMPGAGTVGDLLASGIAAFGTAVLQSAGDLCEHDAMLGQQAAKPPSRSHPCFIT
jgi:hypothetical protein